MKSLPLRVKVALWSALSAAAAMALALCGVLYFLQNELLEGKDKQLDDTARDIFWNLDHLPGGPVENRTEINEDLMPPSTNNRLVEISDNRNGRVMYRSNTLRDDTLSQKSEERQEIQFGVNPYRVAVYYHKFLSLHLGIPLQGHYLLIDRIKLALLASLPAVIVLSLVGGLWVAGRALRPVAAITAAAEHITAEALHQRLPVPLARDEISHLSEVLNKTFARLETSFNQAVHFASDASHQLKTPIAVMRICIDTLMKQRDLRPDQDTQLSDLLQQTRRLASLADGLLLLARADAGRLEMKTADIDLIPLLEGCMEDAEILSTPHGIQVFREIPEELHALADAPRTEQVLLNLLENAVKYNRSRGGTLTVTAGTDEEGVFVVVANTGMPIPGEKMPYIFNRFTRGETDESRTGHGLGLSIARELARAEGGDLRLLRSDAEITEFELRLRPAPAPAPPAPPAPKPEPALATAS